MSVENLRKKFSVKHTKALTVYQVKVQNRILKMVVKDLQKACTDRSPQVKLFAGKFLYFRTNLQRRGDRVAEGA